MLFCVLEEGQNTAPSRQTVVPGGPGSVFCAGSQAPKRERSLGKWRTLRTVYRFSCAVVPLRGMLVFCHLRHGVCWL